MAGGRQKKDTKDGRGMGRRELAAGEKMEGRVKGNIWKGGESELRH